LKVTFAGSVEPCSTVENPKVVKAHDFSGIEPEPHLQLAPFEDGGEGA